MVLETDGDSPWCPECGHELTADEVAALASAGSKASAEKRFIDALFVFRDAICCETEHNTSI